MRATAFLILLILVHIPNAYATKQNLYVKGSLGYIHLNKFNDYTPGRKDSIDGISPKNSSFSTIEAGYQIYHNFRMGIALQHYKHKYSTSFMDDWNNRVVYDYDLNILDEITNLYTPFRQDNLKIKTTVLLLNAYYDLNKIGNFKPYLVFGIGVARHKSSDYTINLTYYDKLAGDTAERIVKGKSKNAFAWSVGIGGEFPITDSVTVDISGQYFAHGKTATSDATYDNNEPRNIGYAGTNLKGITITTGLVLKF